MNIVIVGSCGHWGYVFQGLRTGEDSIVAVAPGGPDESMDSVLETCRNNNHQPMLFEDYRAALDVGGVDMVVVNHVRSQASNFSLLIASTLFC